MEVEQASAQIDVLIGKRSRMEEQSREEEMAWKASVRAYNAHQVEERRSAWLEHHIRMAAIHEDLARNHRQNAAALDQRSSEGA